MLRVNITDVMIPGNGGLDLRIGRSYGTPSMSTAERTPYGYGWTMHFGRIVMDTRHSDKLCNQYLLATSVIYNPSLELFVVSIHLLVIEAMCSPNLINRKVW